MKLSKRMTVHLLYRVDVQVFSYVDEYTLHFLHTYSAHVHLDVYKQSSCTIMQARKQLHADVMFEFEYMFTFIMRHSIALPPLAPAGVAVPEALAVAVKFEVIPTWAPLGRCWRRYLRQEMKIFISAEGETAKHYLCYPDLSCGLIFSLMIHCCLAILIVLKCSYCIHTKKPCPEKRSFGWSLGFSWL